MGAIAYVTDEKMIEYHRVNGSNSIVFGAYQQRNFLILILVICCFSYPKTQQLKLEKRKD